MSENKQSGFSLIELLVVMTVLVILTIITFPFLKKAKDAAEKNSAHASMKTMLSAETSYYTIKSRFARMDELNAAERNTLGITQDGKLTRGEFSFELEGSPTDDDLRNGFTIIGTKPGIGGESPTVITINHHGDTTIVY